MNPKDTPGGSPDCPPRDVLTDYFLGLLPPGHRTAVEEHLASCPACRATLSDISEAAGSDEGSNTSTDSQPIHSTSAGEPRETPVGRGKDAADRSPTPPLLPRFLGQYQLIDKLGQGGMGTVYKAQHTKLKRFVAIKTLRIDRVQNPHAIARFYREMEVVGSLDHPNLVRAFDANEVDGCHFLVMEFLEGVDLAHVADRCGRLSVADACEVVRQAALGLQYVHERGLVHRDVKPSNLLLTAAGMVKVLDLGLARLRPQLEAGDERLTDSSEVLGTADYMAPEQGTKSHDVDIRADVYSLGCTLYKLLTGKAPFGGPEYGSFFQKMLAHAQNPVPSIRNLRPDVPEGLIAVLNRMLAKEPSGRFTTPGEVALALEPFTSGCNLPSLAALPVKEEPFRREDQATILAPPETTRSRRIRLWQGVTAALLLAGFTVGGVVLLLSGSGGKPTPIETKPADLTPGVWHEVQDRNPVVLRKPEHDLDFDWKVVNGQLRVHAPKFCLIRLGETADADYEIEAIISQKTWVGGAGLFIGYRELANDQGKPNVRYQYIQVMPAGPKKPGQFKVSRSVTTHEAAGTSSGQQAGDQDLQPPMRMGDHRLYLKVGKDGLETVSWDEQELSNIPAANKKVRKDDYQGAFGICGYESDSTFRRVRYRFQPRGNP